MSMNMLWELENIDHNIVYAFEIVYIDHDYVYTNFGARPNYKKLAEKQAMYAGNGGTTKPDGYFLTPFMPKSMEMALQVPTKTFLPRSPDTAMLFAPSGCTHPPPPVPPFHHEAESLRCRYATFNLKGLT